MSLLPEAERHALEAALLGVHAIPERVLSPGIFFGASTIVAWVTDHLPEGDEHPMCPVGAGRAASLSRRHIGQLDRSAGHIVWQCPLGGDTTLSLPPSVNR